MIGPSTGVLGPKQTCRAIGLAAAKNRQPRAICLCVKGGHIGPAMLTVAHVRLRFSARPDLPFTHNQTALSGLGRGKSRLCYAARAVRIFSGKGDTA